MEELIKRPTCPGWVEYLSVIIFVAVWFGSAARYNEQAIGHHIVHHSKVLTIAKK